MHSTKTCSTFFYFTLIFYLFLLTSATHHKIHHFDAIYNFGDSLSDTGNLLLRDPNILAGDFPYGETFPGTPTGRWSDGLLIIDFIAMALRRPLLNPSLATNASFAHGVNFATAGAPAQDEAFFIARNITILNNTLSLDIQLMMFETFLNSTSPRPSLRRALVLVSEIGGNDIFYSLSQGKSIQEVRNFVPLIVGAIASAVIDVIQQGAVRVVVQGMFPFGCFPLYLTTFSSADPSDYDDLGCLISINNLTMLHNTFLQGSLVVLRKLYPKVAIIYSDLYQAFLTVFRRQARIDPVNLLKACCGIGGQYNYDRFMPCAFSGVPVCRNPDRFIHWDGIHLTQETHRRISKIIIPPTLA